MSTATSTPRSRSGRASASTAASRPCSRRSDGYRSTSSDAQRAHAAAAHAGAAAQRVAELGVVAVVRRQPVGGRLQLVGDAGEVLDDAVVQLGGDAAALGLERVLARRG